MEADQTQPMTRCPACARGVVEATRGPLSLGRPQLTLLEAQHPNPWRLWGQQPPWLYPHPWSHQPIPIPPHIYSDIPSTYMPGGGDPAYFQ